MDDNIDRKRAADLEHLTTADRIAEQPVGWIWCYKEQPKQEWRLASLKKVQYSTCYYGEDDTNGGVAYRVSIKGVSHEVELTNQIIANRFVEELNKLVTPSSAGLIEAAEFVKGCAAAIQAGTNYTSMEVRIKLGAIEAALRARAADRSAT